jgi:hypothetical protein
MAKVYSNEGLTLFNEWILLRNFIFIHITIYWLNVFGLYVQFDLLPDLRPYIWCGISYIYISYDIYDMIVA